MSTERREVELLEKNQPQQQRAIKTYESILDSAAELLVEAGLERISTNLIAEKAGITVPALYRYFPNKYSILNALGTRLMDRQNQAILNWHEQNVVGAPAGSIPENIADALYAAYTATCSLVGGVQIMHALQAIAPLQQVRQDNHWGVSETFAHLWAEQFGIEFDPDAVQRARVAVELGYATIQLAIEDDRCEPEVVLREGAQAIGLYLESVLRASGFELD
ncbi:MAG: TetR/AcrR family transcriptional regulator [Gammaproteobacteria bacterium]|nr:TetR/AcrR family transcriptional regulator [Gammaproteobacteria bacterium]